MNTTEIVAQIIGIIAMAFNILSYQFKKKGAVITAQLLGATCFAVNFLMLGAVVGGILNILAAVRAVVFLFKDKLKTDRLPWLIGFTVCYIAVYILNFTVFGKAPTVFNLIIEILPVIGMLALNLGFMRKNAADIRKFGLISSPAWLIYNIFAGSWGAIICEALTLISIFVGMARIDKGTQNETNIY